MHIEEEQRKGLGVGIHQSVPHLVEDQQRRVRLGPLEGGIEELGLEPAVVFNIVGSNVVDFRRRQGATFSSETLDQLLDLIARHGVMKENVPEILDRMVRGESLESIADDLTRDTIDLESAVETVIDGNRTILDNPHRHAILMGELMGSLRGRVEGESVSRALTAALARR